MKLNDEDHEWRDPDPNNLDVSAVERAQIVDHHGKVVLIVGDPVLIVAEPHWTGDSRDHFKVGEVHKVAALYNDWVAALDTNQQKNYVSLDCVEVLEPVTEDELAATLRSLGVDQ